VSRLCGNGAGGGAVASPGGATFGDAQGGVAFVRERGGLFSLVGIPSRLFQILQTDWYVSRKRRFRLLLLYLDTDVFQAHISAIP
jgi:hypothetical protein